MGVVVCRNFGIRWIAAVVFGDYWIVYCENLYGNKKSTAYYYSQYISKGTKMSRILVIAGGDWQVPIIRTAKSMGYFVVNTNLYADSPGFAYADEGVVVDVYDVQKY
jgi:hypothetical protein